MKEQVRWRGQVEFSGDAAHFRDFFKLLIDSAARIHLETKPASSSIVVKPSPGIPPDLELILGKLEYNQLVTATLESNPIQLESIAGGIRDPHLHLKGQIVLIDKAVFKETLVKVAQRLVADRVDRMTDYAEVVVGLAGENPGKKA